MPCSRGSFALGKKVEDSPRGVLEAGITGSQRTVYQEAHVVAGGSHIQEIMEESKMEIHCGLAERWGLQPPPEGVPMEVWGGHADLRGRKGVCQIPQI